ncbi:ABC-three component system protein [Xanthomonas campestris]|uniref:ABC-three component system protein n=1 Tax=Xanthomonas campestris TaxID=339 RepID=UPI001E40C082|nr:ABC-three component system protein [Xanthomonas campestris]MCC8684780.1 hypothetical protein [Xanthomonas campestris]MCW1998412.1 hypothetical protein [Xanthomonas campestris]MEA9677860.1 ABC-three component system protein [Xanthomonas campestris pv. raphani]MEA9697559.1 ABC-three component system protein [Xanthomonas campestris pv. raphani]MEA9779499.1 ABC-three component system protein [Xanthomonas campestris pv. raphani]
MFTNQNHNYAHGDIVAGNKHVTFSGDGCLPELKRLYEKLRSDGIGDPSTGFSEDLQHYLTAKTDGDVRGLAEKLSESNRLDQLDLATELKEKATKAIMKRQMSRTAQRVYSIVLDEIHAGYSLRVSPLIESDCSRIEVDAQVIALLKEISSLLGENSLEISVKDLLGLLYFLGGNCHIRWDKC